MLEHALLLINPLVWAMGLVLLGLAGVAVGLTGFLLSIPFVMLDGLFVRREKQ